MKKTTKKPVGRPPAPLSGKKDILQRIRITKKMQRALAKMSKLDGEKTIPEIIRLIIEQHFKKEEQNNA